MNDHHIVAAIDQAKKEGNKGVRGFTGNHDDHIKYSDLRHEGKLETYIQEYYHSTGSSSILLMRKPKLLKI